MRTSLLAIAIALAACKDDGGAAPDGTTTDSTESATTSFTATLVTGVDGSSSGGGQSGCAASPEAMADCVEPERYAADVEFIADIRTPGSVHWQAVQDLCANRLTELGYEVQMFAYATGIDVLGRKPGTSLPDEIVLVGAHYDHIPDCLGADDNATGVAASLEIARVLAMAELERTVLVACWDEEELGLEGSTAFVQAAVAEGLSVVQAFNFDMIGFYSEAEGSQSIPPGLDLAFPMQYAEIEAMGFRGDFVAVVADELSHTAAEAYMRHAQRVELRTAWLELPGDTKNSELFGDLRRSDHAPFWMADYPAIFFTDTGEFRNDHYHCLGGPDTVEDLDHDFSVKVVRASVGAMAEAAGLQ